MGDYYNTSVFFRESLRLKSLGIDMENDNRHLGLDFEINMGKALDRDQAESLWYAL